MNIRISTIPILLIGFLLWNANYRVDSDPKKMDSAITQCHATTQAFAALGNDHAFLDVHETPKPYSKEGQVGKMITYPVTDGAQANAYVINPGQPAGNEYLFVIHEWYGLNDYVKSESNKLASRFPGMTVVALDLYDGKEAHNSDEASKYMQAVQTERALAIIKGAKKYAGDKAKIFTLGWCFGGGWSLQTAIELGVDAKGAIMFYGMPETNMDRLSRLKCDVLAIFANKDKWITPEVAKSFQNTMDKLDNELILKAYDADHGFANPSNPKFNKEAANDAYKVMFDFIRTRQ